LETKSHATLIIITAMNLNPSTCVSLAVSIGRQGLQFAYCALSNRI